MCDDARGLRIEHVEADAKHPMRITVTASDGRVHGVLPAVLVPPLRPEDALPRSRMARVVAEVGEGALAQTYTLFVGTRDTREGARYQNREVLPEDPREALVLFPESGASFLELMTSDPWTDPDYGRIAWSEPWLDWTHVDRRAVPHPSVKPRSTYWKISVHDAPPERLTGREQPASEARAWTELRCALCGDTSATIERALDDSGTGWRQLFVVLRCDRCGRRSLWHYDD